MAVAEGQGKRLKNYRWSRRSHEGQTAVCNLKVQTIKKMRLKSKEQAQLHRRNQIAPNPASHTILEKLRHFRAKRNLKKLRNSAVWKKTTGPPHCSFSLLFPLWQTLCSHSAICRTKNSKSHTQQVFSSSKACWWQSARIFECKVALTTTRANMEFHKDYMENHHKISHQTTYKPHQIWDITPIGFYWTCVHKTHHRKRAHPTHMHT